MNDFALAAPRAQGLLRLPRWARPWERTKDDVAVAVIGRAQAKKNDNGTATTATSVGAGQGWSGTSAGNLVVVVVGSYGGGSSNIPTITDSGGSTYTRWLTTAPSGSLRITVFYLANCGAGITSVTVTPTAICSVLAVEYSGIDTAAPADQIVAAAHEDAGAVTTWSSNSITTTATGLLIGACFSISTGSGSFAPSGAWGTLLRFNNAGDNDDAFAEEQLNVASGTYSAAGTMTSGADPWSVVMSFKAAASAPKSLVADTRRVHRNSMLRRHHAPRPDAVAVYTSSTRSHWQSRPSGLLTPVHA